MTTHIIEVARVTPAAGSDSVPHSLKIPLTFFDLPWLLFSPVKRVFFFRHTESTREHFHSFILPKLKLSLSLVLRNYHPLAGRITWDPNEPKPSIVVSPNDAVLVTIAETKADFFLLSGYGQRPLSELYNLLPELPVSDDSATVLSLQITLFPNNGFSIGVVTHHAVLDGKTSSTFIKAWAHVCKQHLENNGTSSLPEILSPSYDRSLINRVTGVDEEMIAMLRSLKGDATNSSRSLTPFPAKKLGDDVFGTVAGSTRLKVYESDFGWGRPVKVDIVSIDQGEAIAMAERREQSGGVEIGLCLKKTEMDIVLSIFNNGLQN
ncbi:hypothetical protein HID58_076946 [Brassica napus]|uniref:Uncharacterized protein n=1 Tax=Brassica napus TaxID=3708 RepID=A0ABQ7YQ20_BRANA|nr:hypothetical protein HID58_076946 [Brassica napus]